MPFSFPSSPAVGATSTQNGRQYVYAGSNTWELVAASSGGSVVTAATVSAFPATGSSGVIYVATDTARVYQWQGAYVEVGAAGGGASTGMNEFIRSVLFGS